MNKEMYVVYATDSGYLLQTFVSAASCVLASSDPADIVMVVLDCGISQDKWEWFESLWQTRVSKVSKLIRHKVDVSRYEGIKTWRSGLAAYSRIDLPAILPDVDWCVYADGDTLFTGDVRELEKSKDENLALLGHLDTFEEAQVDWYRQHGYEFDRKHHICSGFLLMNLKWMRENDTATRCLEFMKSNVDVKNPDQDALNIVLTNHIGLLPDQWGKFAFYLVEYDCRGCLHYVWKRPWNMHLRDLFPLLPVHEVWLRSMANVLGVRKWQFAGVGFWRYAACTVKTKVALAGFRVLNVLPGLRGRYDAAVRLAWTNENIDRLVCRPLQACKEEGK